MPQAAQIPSGVSLDHIGVFSPDLGVTSRQYEALGFRLTPQSQHSRPPTPEAPTAMRGTANRCAMLQQGYIELLGVVDPTLDTLGVPEAMARYVGMHILAFGMSDAYSEADRLREQGFDPSQSILERRVSLPDGEDVARFIQLRPNSAMLPEGRVFMLHHATPALVWQPRYLDHPNTAIGLAEITVVVSDLDEAAGRYRRYLNCEPQSEAGLCRFVLSQGALRLVSRERLENLLPGVDVPCLPFPVASTITVSNLDTAIAHLRAHAVPFEIASDSVIVSAQAAGGMTLVFQEPSNSIR